MNLQAALMGFGVSVPVGGGHARVTPVCGSSFLFFQVAVFEFLTSDMNLHKLGAGKASKRPTHM